MQLVSLQLYLVCSNHAQQVVPLQEGLARLLAEEVGAAADAVRSKGAGFPDITHRIGPEQIAKRAHPGRLPEPMNFLHVVLSFFSAVTTVSILGESPP